MGGGGGGGRHPVWQATELQAGAGLETQDHQPDPKKGPVTIRQLRKPILPRQPKDQPVQPKPPKLDALAQLNHHAAGLDIGDAEIYAAVPKAPADTTVRVFRTFTTDLQALADWLTACQVDTVAMESTGVYWIPIYELLEARGFQVYLVNARQLKNVSGKKTDILDCQWIQQLHTYGLLQPSFRPPEDICALRALIRHRGNLLRSCAAEIQHMQKALQQMNLELTNVLSDITGLTGLAIIRDIVAGVRDPLKLALHSDPHCRKSAAEIAASLTGNYKAGAAVRAPAGVGGPRLSTSTMRSLRCGNRAPLWPTLDAQVGCTSPNRYTPAPTPAQPPR